MLGDTYLRSLKNSAGAVALGLGKPGRAFPVVSRLPPLVAYPVGPIVHRPRRDVQPLPQGRLLMSVEGIA